MNPFVKTLAFFLALFVFVAQVNAEGIKRMDCDAFCKKTGFRFNAGVCKCGYMLFANKRSVADRDPRAEAAPDSQDDYVRGLGDMSWAAPVYPALPFPRMYG
ncbi:uncharacterized protein LOC100904613 [Galendromus occidentalis]|uniref:Uncharacterized protein LOC100904613 n=1 Tax=Galendromus occidentalis TaxID=34638 RepID=A0AAJ6VXR2_9ACAR|nr:uncharacterized protein LOC100904613 [Galendromus occidentalis]